MCCFLSEKKNKVTITYIRRDFCLLFFFRKVLIFDHAQIRFFAV